MKNMNIVAAVFAVMAAASVAGAQEIKVDFDGQDRNIGALGATRTFAFDANAVQVPEVKKDNKDTEAATPAAKSPDERSLNEILSGLNGTQKLLVFESLKFNKEGKLTSIYTKDIKAVLGEKGLKEVLGKFGINVDATKGGLRALDNKWCVSTGTCGYNKDYACTENC